MNTQEIPAQILHLTSLSSILPLVLDHLSAYKHLLEPIQSNNMFSKIVLYD